MTCRGKIKRCTVIALTLVADGMASSRTTSAAIGNCGLDETTHADFSLVLWPQELHRIFLARFLPSLSTYSSCLARKHTGMADT